MSDEQECQTCNGDKTVPAHFGAPADRDYCPTCNGTGQRRGCATCRWFDPDEADRLGGDENDPVGCTNEEWHFRSPTEYLLIAHDGRNCPAWERREG